MISSISKIILKTLTWKLFDAPKYRMKYAMVSICPISPKGPIQSYDRKGWDLPSSKKWWWSASYMSPKYPFHFSPQFSFSASRCLMILLITKPLHSGINQGINCLSSQIWGWAPRSGWRTFLRPHPLRPQFLHKYPRRSLAFWGLQLFPTTRSSRTSLWSTPMLTGGHCLWLRLHRIGRLLFSSCSSKHRRLWGLSMFKKQMSEKGRNNVEYDMMLKQMIRFFWTCAFCPISPMVWILRARSMALARVISSNNLTTRLFIIGVIYINDRRFVPWRIRTHILQPLIVDSLHADDAWDSKGISQRLKECRRISKINHMQTTPGQTLPEPNHSSTSLGSSTSPSTSLRSLCTAPAPGEKVSDLSQWLPIWASLGKKEGYERVRV